MSQIARFVIWICSKFTKKEIEQIVAGLVDILQDRNPEVKPKDDFQDRLTEKRDCVHETKIRGWILSLVSFPVDNSIGKSLRNFSSGCPRSETIRRTRLGSFSKAWIPYSKERSESAS